MEYFKLKLDRTSIEHRRPSNNVRSLLPSSNSVTKEPISQSTHSESFRAKMRDTPTYFPILTILYSVSNCLYFHVEWRKGRHFWCENCRFVCFETGLGKPMLTLNNPNGFKNTTYVYSIHLKLCMAFICQISDGKWKYVNPCLDFLGKPDQRTAYVKRQVRPGWTYVRRSGVTPDLVMASQITNNSTQCSTTCLSLQPREHQSSTSPSSVYTLLGNIALVNDWFNFV